MRQSVAIIAEAGVNHNGDPLLAKKLIDAAAAAGADAVKFQTFETELGIRRQAAKAAYQLRTTNPGESQFEMIRKLELSHDVFRELAAYCRTAGISFLSTPYDLKSARFLADIGLETFKISSGDLRTLPLLRFVGSLNRQVIISSGLAGLTDIRAALDELHRAGAADEKISLLHCTTQYPTPFENANLRAIQTLASEFPSITIGYSDHTPGIEASLAAVALGARIIEKHFTLDKTLPGPDHQASLEPNELTALVKGIRRIEKALGSGLKEPCADEMENAPVAYKSIVAAEDIAAGERLTEANLTVKRPGAGLSPMLWDRVCGTAAIRAFKKDEDIEITAKNYGGDEC